jgi:hypothetical protein
MQWPCIPRQEIESPMEKMILLMPFHLFGPALLLLLVRSTDLEIESDLSQVPGGSAFPIRTHTRRRRMNGLGNKMRAEDYFVFQWRISKLAPSGQVSLKLFQLI